MRVRNVTEASDNAMRTLEPSSSAVDKGNQFRAFFTFPTLPHLMRRTLQYVTRHDGLHTSRKSKAYLPGPPIGTTKTALPKNEAAKITSLTLDYGS